MNLPATAPLGVEGAVVPLTILESVVKSTGIYASSRKGRLSVFWGDQVFVPTKSYEYDAKRAHAAYYACSRRCRRPPSGPPSSRSSFGRRGEERFDAARRWRLLRPRRRDAVDAVASMASRVPRRLDAHRRRPHESPRTERASGSATLTDRSGEHHDTITTQARPARSRRSTTRPLYR